MAYHLFSKQFLIAKKAHRCIWCYHAIHRLDVYLREKSIFDGSHQNFAWHWDCWFYAHETYFRHGEEGFISGQDRPPMLPFRCMEAA